MKTYSFEDHKKELLKNPEIRKEYDALEPEFAIACAIIEGRMKKNLTQKQLAEALNTRQSVISRVEGARTTPTVSFLKRLAAAFNMKLQIRFIPS